MGLLRAYGETRAAARGGIRDGVSGESAMKQSRMMSLVEATANVVFGYVLAIATQIVVFPWFGIKAGLAEHIGIGLIFVGVSLVRGYVLRRIFDAMRF
jgi:hypothetical protein